MRFPFHCFVGVMHRPLLLSASSAVLLLLVSAGTGQAHDVNIVSSAADETLDTRGEKDVEEEEVYQETHGGPTRDAILLFKEPKPALRREARSRLLRMNSLPAPIPEMETIPFIPESSPDTLLRVRELMSRLSLLFPHKAGLLSLDIATPENSVTPPSDSLKAEPTASALAAVLESPPAAVHEGTFPSSGSNDRRHTVQNVAGVTGEKEETAPLTQTGPATLGDEPTKNFENRTPQVAGLRGAASSREKHPPEAAPADWSAVPTSQELGASALESVSSSAHEPVSSSAHEPVSSSAVTENSIDPVTEAAVALTYTGFTNVLDALEIMKSWTDEMWSDLMTSARMAAHDFKKRAIKEGKYKVPTESNSPEWVDTKA